MGRFGQASSSSELLDELAPPHCYTLRPLRFPLRCALLEGGRIPLGTRLLHLRYIRDAEGIRQRVAIIPRAERQASLLFLMALDRQHPRLAAAFLDRSPEVLVEFPVVGEPADHQ